MDIDKLFLSGLNYKTEGVENIFGYVEQHLVKESELTEEHQLQNKIIDMYLALLIDKKDNSGPRNVQILHRSIDNDTDLAKSVLKDIEGSGKSKTETPYSFYSLARQTASKNDYITGKVGIGPFALNNNNQILTMIYHISFRESQSSLLSTLGLSRLDKQLDVDGNSIMSWISAMINAHVDIAKDPWISRLNVNPFSYNITNLLLRTGWGGNTFYFLTQPIMKQMADAYVKASSQYMQQNGSTYSRQQQSIKDVAEQYFGKDVTFDGNTLDDALSLIDAGDKESIQAINKAIKKLLESEQFKQDARDYAQGNDVADQKGLKSRQLGIYLAYVQFSKYANALANLVKYCKIDTKKHGKSAAEQLVYKEGFDELFEFATDEDGVLIKKGDVGALFEPAGLLDLVEHSYVGTKTRNAISLTKVILGRQFMSSTTGFIQMLRQLNTMAGNTSLSVSFVQSAQKALSAAIKSEFFNDYASRISDNPRYMHDLVNSSSEDLEFSYDASTNSMSITGNKHSLKSYVGQPILLWYKDKDGNLQQYIPRDKNGNALPLKVLTAKDDKIQLNISINGNFNGVCRLLGGANTIFDRLSRLKPMIYHNNDYSDLQGNLLLEMLIPGKRVEYSPKDAVLGERPDTYDDLKFVKLQNFVDDGGINTNYIINAWNELLEYQNDKQPQVAEYIRNFARDLVVYAFITSGDTQGFAKMFKYTPASWRKKSGYADFINRKLEQLNSYIPTVDLNDVLLNNWYDNKLVPTYQFYSKDANGKRSSNFIGVAKMKIINGNKQTQSAYPTILAALKKNDEGMYEPSIAVESSPKFIKIPRSYNHYDSQRQYNVYQLYGFARHDSGIMYPVYVLVQPKGTKVSGGFMVTEYGRDDSTPSSTEYVVNQGTLRDFVESADFINQLPAIKKNFGDEYAAILNDLRTEQTGGVAAAITDNDQAQPINTGNQPSTANNTTVDSGTAQFYSGGAVGSDTEWGNVAQKYGFNITHYAVNDYDKLSRDDKESIEKQYKEVVERLQRKQLSADSYSGKLVRRDMLQANSADSILAIGRLGKNGHVDGGTAYATERGIIRGIPVYLFDQNDNHWKTYNGEKFVDCEQPSLTQHAALIGTRQITDDGKRAIQNVFKTQQTTNKTQQQTQSNDKPGTTQSQTSTPTSTDSSEKSITEQLVRHLKDCGFTVYGIDKNDIERDEDYQFAIERPNTITTETDDYEQRLQTILDKAPRNSEGRLLAPNDKPSNLPERLYAQVRTKEFKDWFGDWQNDPKNASKVVDENGEPRIVYHGSDQYGFDVFDPSHSDDERSLFASGSEFIALTYRSNFGDYKNGSGLSQNILNALHYNNALFLNIKNPLIVEHPKPKSENDRVYYWMDLDINIGDGRPVKTRYAAKYAQDNGYDGVIITNIYNHGPHRGEAKYDPVSQYIREKQESTLKHNFEHNDVLDVQNRQWLEVSDIFIAFESNQVKSAGGENKTFSRTNNNIHLFKDSKGVVYGYIDNHGNIHFDKNKFRPDDPIYEHTHIWDGVFALKYPSLWIRGVKLMKQFDGGKLWNEIANSEFYGKKWSNMSDAQREFMIASEVHTRLVGEGGAKLISEIEAKQGSSDIIPKLEDWIFKFWWGLNQTFTTEVINEVDVTEVINGVDVRSSISDKIEMVGLVNYSSGIDVSEDAQRAIDKIKAISPNEQQYITPVITGESYIPGVSLIDAINIAAKIKSANRYSQVSDKIVRKKISQVEVLPDKEVLFNLLNLGTVPNNLLLMLADYINYDDARGIVAGHIAAYLEQCCQKKSYYDVAIPIIKSIDVKYDDSRQQSQFNDDIMKHCKGN